MVVGIGKFVFIFGLVCLLICFCFVAVEHVASERKLCACWYLPRKKSHKNRTQKVQERNLAGQRSLGVSLGTGVLFQRQEIRQLVLYTNGDDDISIILTCTYVCL